MKSDSPALGGHDSHAGRLRIEALDAHYRSGLSDLARDFFGPCLSSCISYKRAVGFFSSSALISWAGALPRIMQKDDVGIQLLASPLISEQDRLALEKAATPEDRDRLLQELSDRIVLDAVNFANAPHDVELRMRLFVWMVAAGRLEIRFAFPTHIDAPGMFHEKIGIFEFPWEATVAFTGSANESTYGHSRNYESIDVFRDWVPTDVDRVRVKAAQFAEAWGGEAEGLRVLPLSEQALACVRSMAAQPIPTTRPVNADQSSSDKWRHQDEAISAFLKLERGVLEMATGTGKTFTALRICQELQERNDVATIIVAADGTDLLDQWYSHLLKLSTQLAGAFAVIRHYGGHHERDRFQLEPSRKVLLASRLALAPAIRGLTPEVRKTTLLIHDEVHRLGSPSNRESLSQLSDHIRFRLGLSATPEREYDDDGTQFITDHIGPVIYRFGLENAIQRGILSPFDYYPLPYETDDEDRQRIRNVHARAAARKEAGRPMLPEEIWTELARVHKTSRAKLPVFATFIERNKELLARCIIFVETKEYGEEVLGIVHRHRHDFHTYFAGEDSDLLHKFAKGTIECLLTCHRLSEGIDIHSLQNVILFSSAATRLETIQRMGRCLRVDPENPDKVANVVDFIRMDNQTDRKTADEVRQEWLAELSSIRPGVIEP